MLNSLRPEAIGGKPELGCSHFEKAVQVSGGRNLYAKTLFAQFYARLVFDQELHDRLCDALRGARPRVAFQVFARNRSTLVFDDGSVAPTGKHRTGRTSEGRCWTLGAPKRN